MQGKSLKELLVVSKTFNAVRLWSLFLPEGQVFKRLIFCVEFHSTMLVLLSKTRLETKPFKNCYI